MNKAQTTALDYYCRMATETIHPRFYRETYDGRLSVCLTVNTGYE